MPDRLRPNVGSTQEEQRPKPAGVSGRLCSGIHRWIQDISVKAVNSLIWRVLVVLFTLLLLFGSPIQFWMVPAKGDYAFDALYALGFVFFWVDIIFNAHADPEYFYYEPFRSQQVPNPNARNQTRSCSFRLGSYNFWCDFVSSGGFLYDISFINRSEFAMIVIPIALDSMGVPTNFDSLVYGVGSWALKDNFNYFVMIFKTARVARLVPSTRVVAISTRINMYWYVERLTPTFYWRGWKENREQARRMNEEIDLKRSSSNLARRASWGGLDIAALAAVKVMGGEERREKERHNPVHRAWAIGKDMLRLIGVLPNTNVEMDRHIAATKIQRAWRSRLAKTKEARSDDGMQGGSVEGNFVWTGREGASASTVKKRSMLNRTINGAKIAGRSSDKHIRGAEAAPEYQLSSNGNSRHQYHRNTLNGKHSRADRSQVGPAMAENTGERVGVFILLSLLFVLMFNYQENDSTRPSTMVVLHGQTTRSQLPTSARKAVDTARKNAIPSIYYYSSNSSHFKTEISVDFMQENFDASTLRDREKMRILVNNSLGTSEGYFVIKKEQVHAAQIEFVATIFVLLIWFFGVASFAGPIMTFVIIPIERMVRLLGMLMMDPLGYQSNLRFKKFLAEEDQIVKKSQWTREVLKGMETSFLMSTILRIGSLMKVGFGSAGVEIIRNNLQKGQSKNKLILNSQGSTVSCIFLFCDIRQFTDATECLQEEVFVFTNRIAAVVHSICHSYGGSANKNVGDAFLVSWLLEDESTGTAGRFSHSNSPTYVAKHHEADKALLSVVKICMALHHDDYYVETMSNLPRTALLNKLKKRPGPIVQMGFGLHAGKAVQGAIGSQKKIDATYVSEAVERAEYLETSTKKYKVQLLMSDNFHRLLHASNRRRCRKVDQIMFQNKDDDDYEEEAYGQGDVMELFTYDLDVDALWEDTKKGGEGDISEPENEEASISSLRRIPGSSSSSKGASANPLLKKTRRLSKRTFDVKGPPSSDDSRSASLGSQGDGQVLSDAATAAITGKAAAEGLSLTILHESDAKDQKSSKRPELILPTGPALYSSNVWLQTDMRRIRRRYTPVVFSTFNSGLQKYYDKDWAGARQCFEAIVDRFDDGPSQYFLDQMEKNKFTPPPHFQSYGKA